jgi:acetyltransferase-like isoleucine patch superfamily enzyme
MLKWLKRWIKEKRHPFYTNQNKKYRAFEIGDFTYGKPSILSGGEGATLKIGKFCSIAGGVTIYLGAEHHSEWVTNYTFNKLPVFARGGMTKTKGDVIIGNDVWMADNALILSGVTIGNGAVIGARAVVTKDVKPYEVVAGNPVRHIRFRFSDEQIAKLQKIKWWDWEVSKIEESFPLLLSENIDDFISKYS